ncbi:MAG: glycosyltransferase [Desulfovibrionaceae bacterium]|nr:glycosyltransferase [Desulfovibrionaceae bacterium]
MNTEPLVSVIVPVYNAASTLPKLADALLKQSLSPLEIIFVDDQSSDNSLLCCQHYAKQHPERIRVIAMAHKGYAGGCRNVGIQAARGLYVGFADADDSLKAEMFACLYAAAEKEHAEMAVCGFQQKQARYTRDILPAATLNAASLAADKRFSAALWNKLLRRDWLLDHDIFCPAVRCAEDAAFMLKVLSQNPRIASVPLPLYEYSIHGAGLSAPMQARCDVLAALDDVRAYIASHPPRLPFGALYRHAVVMHALYHPFCLLVIDSLWHGRRRWQNLRESPRYLWHAVRFLLRGLRL